MCQRFYQPVYLVLLTTLYLLLRKTECCHFEAALLRVCSFCTCFIWLWIFIITWFAGWCMSFALLPLYCFSPVNVSIYGVDWVPWIMVGAGFCLSFTDTTSSLWFFVPSCWLGGFTFCLICDLVAVDYPWYCQLGFTYCLFQTVYRDVLFILFYDWIFTLPLNVLVSEMTFVHSSTFDIVYLASFLSFDASIPPHPAIYSFAVGIGMSNYILRCIYRLYLWSHLP